MSARVQLRLPDETYARLARAAQGDGVSVSEFVRRAVEDRIAGRSVAAVGRSLAEHLLPALDERIERVLAERGTGTTWSPPKPFDRGCFDADLHRPGQVCAGCGGSF